MNLICRIKTSTGAAYNRVRLTIEGGLQLRAVYNRVNTVPVVIPAELRQ